MLREKFNRGFTPNLVILIIATLVWVPHTLPFFANMASMQIFFAIFLAPLAIVGVICAGFAGSAMVRATQAKIKSLSILIGLEVVCVIGCVIHEIILVGYPFKLCFDFCQSVSLATTIISYFIVATILFAPAYCAILFYRQIS